MSLQLVLWTTARMAPMYLFWKQMPQKLRKSGKGQQVVNQKSGRKLSKKPLPKSRAMAQMKAVQAREGGYQLNCALAKNKKQRSCRKSLKKSARK